MSRPVKKQALPLRIFHLFTFQQFRHIKIVFYNLLLLTDSLPLPFMTDSGHKFIKIPFYKWQLPLLFYKKVILIIN